MRRLLLFELLTAASLTFFSAFAAGVAVGLPALLEADEPDGGRLKIKEECENVMPNHKVSRCKLPTGSLEGFHYCFSILFQLASLFPRQVFPGAQYSNLSTGCISQLLCRFRGLRQ